MVCKSAQSVISTFLIWWACNGYAKRISSFSGTLKSVRGTPPHKFCNASRRQKKNTYIYILFTQTHVYVHILCVCTCPWKYLLGYTLNINTSYSCFPFNLCFVLCEQIVISKSGKTGVSFILKKICYDQYLTPPLYLNLISHVYCPGELEAMHSPSVQLPGARVQPLMTAPFSHPPCQLFSFWQSNWFVLSRYSM